MVGLRNGYLLALKEDFSPVAKTQHCENGQAITVIKFSPDDSLCAVGGKDGTIKIYDAISNFKRTRTKVIIEDNHSSKAITDLEFILNRMYLIVNYNF